MEKERDLDDLIVRELRQPTSAGARAVTEAVLARHGESVRAVIFYGSCLRRQDDRGVLDLYVLVERYREFYSRRYLAWLNALLPPNVLYIEAQAKGETVRAKYAVVSLTDFARYTSADALQPYFWARFAQPCSLVYAADEETAQRVANGVETSVVTFIRRSLPLVPARFTIDQLWTRGLTASYRTEVRPDRAGAPERLYEAAPQRYEEVTRAARVRIPGVRLSGEIDGRTWLEAAIPPGERRAAPLWWFLRRGQGKLLSLTRILKGAITFEGGVDYVLWKIERHTGVEVDPTWREKRYPLLALGGVFWRLYRRGAFS